MFHFLCLLALTCVCVIESANVNSSVFVTIGDSFYEYDILNCDDDTGCTVACSKPLGCHGTTVNCPKNNEICIILIGDGSDILDRNFGSNMTINGGGGNLVITVFGHRQFYQSIVYCPDNKLCSISCAGDIGATCKQISMYGGINGTFLLYGNSTAQTFVDSKFILPYASSATMILQKSSTARSSIFNFTYVNQVRFVLNDYGNSIENDQQCRHCQIYNEYGNNLTILSPAKFGFSESVIYGPENGTINLAFLKFGSFERSIFHGGMNSFVNIICGNPAELATMTEYQNACQDAKIFCVDCENLNISVFQIHGLFNGTVYCPTTIIGPYSEQDKKCRINSYALDSIDLIDLFVKRGTLDFVSFDITDNGINQLTVNEEGTLHCGSDYSGICEYTSVPAGIYHCKTGFDCDSFTSHPSINPTVNPSDTLTDDPTIIPTNYPTEIPTINPTNYPSHNPSVNPTIIPTINPTNNPTINPSMNPTQTFNPSLFPTNVPSFNPSLNPSTNPSLNPSINPTINPSLIPTISPSVSPVHTTITNSPTKDKTLVKKSGNSDSTLIIIVVLVPIIIVCMGFVIWYYFQKQIQNEREKTKNFMIKTQQMIESRSNIQTFASVSSVSPPPPNTIQLEGVSPKIDNQNKITTDNKNNTPGFEGEKEIAVNIIDNNLNNKNILNETNNNSNNGEANESLLPVELLENQNENEKNNNETNNFKQMLDNNNMLNNVLMDDVIDNINSNNETARGDINKNNQNNNFKQMLGDKNIVNDILMDDVINDIQEGDNNNSNDITTPGV